MNSIKELKDKCLSSGFNKKSNTDHDSKGKHLDRKIWTY